jgi:hypothetical protein
MEPVAIVESGQVSKKRTRAEMIMDTQKAAYLE